jgi:EAL domain-containing protein (putative c-di-GMP-specific phosphodiesterase class I)
MIEKIHTEMKEYWEHNPDKKIMKTAINMDARDLLEDEFYYRFTEFFIQNKNAAEILSFELLENAWTDQEEEMIIHKLIELKEKLKLSFSLDDYGK